MDFELDTRTVYDIVKSCEEAGIAELGLSTPWRAERFVEERLMRFEEEINGAREYELEAKEQNNRSVALGAFKQRVKLSSEYTRFLREIGLMPGPGNVKFETLVAQLAAVVSTALGEHGVPEAARLAINDAIVAATGTERRAELPQLMPSKAEIETALAKEREAAAREEAKLELFVEGERRAKAELDREVAEAREERGKKEAETEAERRERQDRIRQEIDEQDARREAEGQAAQPDQNGQQAVNLQSMTTEDRSRFLGAEAPLESRDSWS
jgi:hypothetical protein